METPGVVRDDVAVEGAEDFGASDVAVGLTTVLERETVHRRSELDHRGGAGVVAVDDGSCGTARAVQDHAARDMHVLEVRPGRDHDRVA